MKSEAQQRLQLNQFGDKNSACRPCLCSDFIKVSAVLERKPACVSLPPLPTGERSNNSNTTRAETVLLHLLPLSLCFPVSHSLPELQGVPLTSPVLLLNGIIKDRDKEMSSSEAKRDQYSRHS